VQVDSAASLHQQHETLKAMGRGFGESQPTGKEGAGLFLGYFHAALNCQQSLVSLPE
jgi:hypothetical protein